MGACRLVVAAPMIWDTILEEVGGTLCGLPPGTITAAKGMGLMMTAASSTSTESSTVQQNSSGLTAEEKRIVETAVHNVAVTAKRDNPRWSDRRAARFAMGVVLAANKLYSGDNFRAALLDALSTNPDRHRRLVANVVSGIR